MMEGSPRHLSDCYFYFYSSCTKGDGCPYRHCEQALGTERVCNLWKEGLCLRSNCKFRHMESRIDRNSIPCYWENQPGGCRKPHCVFLHVRKKECSESQELILPVLSGQTSSHTLNVTAINKYDNVESWKQSETLSPSLKTDEDVQSSLEPFVVSFDENEESDSESISSTPVKANDVKSGNVRGSNLLTKFSAKNPGKCLDFEVKSLEQIRLEKIHKESANIYMTDYEVPTLEDYKKKRVLDVDQNYPPSSEFIALQSECSPRDDVSGTATKEIVQGSIKKTGDLRVLLFSHSKEPSVPRDPLGFKIKTLDEIRKEKMVKKEAPAMENGDKKTLEIKIEKVSSETLKKLKINRKSLDSPGNINEGLEGYLKDRANIKQEKSTDFYFKETETLPKAKRKISSGDDEDRNNKMLKIESVEENNHLASDEQIRTQFSPFLKSEHKNLVAADTAFSTNNETSETSGQNSAQTPLATEQCQKVSSNCTKKNRSISTDDIDKFLDDDSNGGGSMEEEPVAEDDILSEINKFLDS